MDLIAGRYEPGAASGAEPVWNPARDVVSGRPATVLRQPVPDDPLTRSRELERVRRYALTRSPHLARVLAVELGAAGEVLVVCEPVRGVLLDPGSPPAGLTPTSVRRIATDLLDALAALHLAGVTHGSVCPDAVLLAAGTAVEPAVTLLPVPLLVRPAASLARSVEDDRHQAATLLLGLLRAVPEHGGEDRDPARALADALEAMGGSGADASTGRGAAAATTPLGAPTAHVPLVLSPHSLAPRPATVVPGGGPAAQVEQPSGASTALVPRGRRRPSRRTALEVGGAGLALAALVAAVVSAGVLGGGPAGGAGRPAAPTTPRAVTAPASPPASPSPPPAPSTEPSAQPLPTTLPALIDALTADPGAAGPSGPVLLEALRGVVSGEDGVVQQSMLRVVTSALDDPGVDPRYGAAAVAAVATGPIPGAPGAPPSCFGVGPGAPDPVVQRAAQAVVDRVPSWQSQGLPTGTAERLLSLATPVAAGQAAPTLAPCPTG